MKLVFELRGRNRKQGRWFRVFLVSVSFGEIKEILLVLSSCKCKKKIYEVYSCFKAEIHPV